MRRKEVSKHYILLLLDEVGVTGMRDTMCFCSILILYFTFPCLLLEGVKKFKAPLVLKTMVPRGGKKRRGEWRKGVKWLARMTDRHVVGVGE